MAFTLKQTFGAGPHTERGTAGKLDICEDGKAILTCSGKAVVIRDARQLTKCEAYTEHTKIVNVARFSPNGNYVASGDEAGMVRVWSFDHPDKLLKKETPVLGGSILDLGWDFENKRLIAGGNGGKGFQVKAFQFDTGSALGEMTGHQKPVTCVAVRPTKPTTVASGSQDFKVGFYKGPPFKFAKCLVEHTNFVQGLRYSWDGELLASVGSDAAIHLFDADSGDSKCDFSDKEHQGSIFGVVFSPDSKQLVTVGGDKTVKLWDVETNKVVTSIAVGKQTEDMQVAVAWGKSGACMTSSLGGDLNAIDWSSGSVTTRIKSHSGEPYAVACDSDSKDIYVGDGNGGVTRYDLEGNGAHLGGRNHTEKVIAIEAKKGKAFTCSVDDTLKEIANKTDFTSSVSLGGQPQALSQTVAHPDLCAFVARTRAGIVKDGRVIAQVELGFEGSGVALSPRLDFLVVGEKGAKPPRARVYQVSDNGTKIVATDKKLDELLAHPLCMSFSPDGTKLAVGDNLKEVSVWSGETFEPLIRHAWVFHTSSVTSLAWSADSKFILSGSTDSHAFIWNPASKMKRTQIKFAHKTGVNAVDWTGPTSIVTCGSDRCVRTWDVELPQ